MDKIQKVYLLTINPEISTIKGIAEYAASIGVDIQFFNPFDQVSLTKVEIEKDAWLLPRTSGVLFDDIDLHLCEAWIHEGAYCPIPIESIKVLRDKDRQYFILKRRNLPLVDTLIHRGALSRENLSLLNPTGEQWVLKSIRGNKGIGIERYTTEELINFWQSALEKNDQRYMIQEFIPQAREIRVLALGQKLYAIEKVNIDGDGQGSGQKNWKKNAQYAKFEKAELSDSENKDFLEYSKIIREELKLPCFAIDFIMNDKTNQWEILEVNVHPGLDASSEAMHRNLYEEYWNALFNQENNQEKEHSLELNF